ncbi:MAG: alpha/beta fold hydrolase [Acidobacteriota bacterium]|nr:MAG: alpha/beta fold hydrolase [Acidobacteriota bacterium]
MSGTKTKVEVTGENGDALGKVSVSLARPARSKATAIISHGAGGTMDSPSIVGVQKQLAANGITAVRFNFLYSEKKKRSPDKQPALVATWRSVADWVKKEVKPKKLFLSGRSMGGRMASYLVAEGYSCDGVFFLAYPLHPPGKPDRQRKEHLLEIKVPMLFVSGTRDAFAQLELLEPVVKKLKAKLHLIEGADHGFKVPKKLGRTPGDVDEEVTAAVLDFIAEV